MLQRTKYRYRFRIIWLRLCYHALWSNTVWSRPPSCLLMVFILLPVTRELNISGDEQIIFPSLSKTENSNQQPQELVATSSGEQYLTANSVSAAADTHERSAVMISVTIYRRSLRCPFNFVLSGFLIKVEPYPSRRIPEISFRTDENCHRRKTQQTKPCGN